jgi:hypothetical protein
MEDTLGCIPNRKRDSSPFTVERGRLRYEKPKHQVKLVFLFNVFNVFLQLFEAWRIGRPALSKRSTPDIENSD